MEAGQRLLYCRWVATVITWGALLGAWLLFLGAIYQAALELGAHEIARDRIAAVASQVAVPPPVSAWWWLLPPVKLVYEQRRTRAYYIAYAMAMSVEDVASMIAFQNKGVGWICVAVGAWLLAVNQTLTIVRERGFSNVVLVAVTTACSAVAILSCVSRISRSKHLVHLRKTGTLR